MTDRENVIDWIETALHDHENLAIARISTDVLRAALALLKEPTVGGWISVEDRLPEDGLLGKLVYDADNGIRVCGKVGTITMANGEKVFTMDAKLIDFLLVGGFNGAPIDSVTHITHWMPLPEPPTDCADYPGCEMCPKNGECRENPDRED